MPEFSVELFNTHRPLVQKTIEQINKDMAGYGFELTVVDLNLINYQALLNILSEGLKKIDIAGRNNLQSILYRIDIPEKHFTPFATSNSYYYQQLADLIIRREYFKVAARIKYSQNS